MERYIFTYSFKVYSKRNKAKTFPCGGAFCAEGARRVAKEIRRDGFEISELRIDMHYNNLLNWDKPLNTRVFTFE